MADLKPVYRAVSKDAAETALDELEERNGSAVSGGAPVVATQMENLSAYFRYPANIRKAGRTECEIECPVHRQFRKLLKRALSENENSLLKLLIWPDERSGKWTMPIQSWNLTLSQLAIILKGG